MNLLERLVRSTYTYKAVQWMFEEGKKQKEEAERNAKINFEDKHVLFCFMHEEIARIADHYGKRNQLMILGEECGELIQASSKMLRYADDEGDIAKGPYINNLAGEIADVEIMCEQIKHLYGISDKVEKYKDYKIKRQIGRIGKNG